MIDAILVFSKKHSQVVIVVLLGIIAAGGIAGSIRVANLQELLSERAALMRDQKEIQDQRMALIQGQVPQLEQGAASREKILSEISTLVKLSAVRDVTAKHIALDSALATSLSNAQDSKSVAILANQLADEASRFEKNLNEAGLSEVSLFHVSGHGSLVHLNDPGVEPVVSRADLVRVTSADLTFAKGMFYGITAVAGVLAVLIVVSRRRPFNRATNS